MYFALNWFHKKNKIRTGNQLEYLKYPSILQQSMKYVETLGIK